jgi:parallel beta-helix repeat protein
MYLNSSAVATLENCKITASKNSGVYVAGASSVSLDNCMVNASTGFNLQSTGTTTLKETYVNAMGHAFYIINTAGITV